MDNSIYQTYQLKKANITEKLSGVMKQNNLLVLLRPLVFLAAVAFSMVYSFLSTQSVYLLFSGMLIIFFLLMIVKHNRIKAKIKYLELLVLINDNAMRRLDGKWLEFSNSGERFINYEHRYTSDLNIFGQGSLFQYINSATSFVGEERLAHMLCFQAGLNEIKLRQQAIKELSPRLDWRQHLQATGMLDSIRQPGNLEKLLTWAEEKPLFMNKYISLLLFCPVITLAVAILGYFHVTTLIPSYLWVFPLALQILIVAITAKTAHQTFSKTCNSVYEVQRCSDLLKCIEAESFDSPLLKKLKRKLVKSSDAPSRQIKKLFSIVDRISMRYSSLYPVINIAVLWDLQTLIRLEKWRSISGRSLRSWIEVIAEFESLSSLAGLAHDHPNWTVPEITESKPAFKAVAMGHPLIKNEVRVCNDVELPEPGTILLITGSNMSGKSTLLRTVGINLILAYAGAPVCAEKLSCSLMNVYTSIHINDNLEKNISTFYAELQRIKLIIDAARSGEAIICLIDEIFKGTNSKDRILGAQAVIKSLNKLAAIGLVSTHDLELSRLEKEISQIKNYHFTDKISGREINFDYRLKPGVSKSTNAIALMKIIGIEIT
ncbi:MutS domain V [Desulfotomaculum arcticum]|uniref:MutS domain V n=1 Tax=Desulfotruncus arcticus DSM 17038 TaxID=1121424 RepID=A0A1I2ZZ79_9FIRM|nr:MutS family DNA mismatch repair protein [Desulfotruncus arcticus]SFH43167.1 MutS domain V [Desulfotomaculum arcticum] [Desulfotruncus arcticus DSM 17038]